VDPIDFGVQNRRLELGRPIGSANCRCFGAEILQRYWHNKGTKRSRLEVNMWSLSETYFHKRDWRCCTFDIAKNCIEFACSRHSLTIVLSKMEKVKMWTFGLFGPCLTPCLIIVNSKQLFQTEHRVYVLHLFFKIEDNYCLDKDYRNVNTRISWLANKNGQFEEKTHKKLNIPEFRRKSYFDCPDCCYCLAVLCASEPEALEQKRTAENCAGMNVHYLSFVKVIGHC
jgi:hypothetical protein